MAIDQRRHGAVRHHLHAAADEGEAVLREVGRRRRKPYPGVQPGLHCVAVGRDDVDRACGKQAAPVPVGDGHGQAVGRAGHHQPLRGAAGQHRAHHHRGRQGPPVLPAEATRRQTPRAAARRARRPPCAGLRLRKRLRGADFVRRYRDGASRLGPPNGGDARQEIVARHLGRQAGERATQRHQPAMLGRQRRVGGDAPLDGQRGGGIELAIDQRVEHQPHAFGVARQSVIMHGVLQVPTSAGRARGPAATLPCRSAR